jgi:hypothetical protein
MGIGLAWLRPHDQGRPRQFFEAYIRLLQQHSHRPEDAPPDARPVYIRLFTLPADED